jgi:hypothetical protein
MHLAPGVWYGIVSNYHLYRNRFTLCVRGKYHYNHPQDSKRLWTVSKLSSQKTICNSIMWFSAHQISERVRERERQTQHYMRRDILTKVRFVMPCSFVHRYQCVRGTYLLNYTLHARRLLTLYLWYVHFKHLTEFTDVYKEYLFI